MDSPMPPQAVKSCEKGCELTFKTFRLKIGSSEWGRGIFSLTLVGRYPLAVLAENAARTS
jgi:hypothetical protein